MIKFTVIPKKVIWHLAIWQNFIIQKLKSKHLFCLSFLWWDFFLGNERKYFAHIPGLNLSKYFLMQSHFIEVAQGAIFIEQNMRFWLILGQLAILKKKWAVKYANFEGGFLCFSGQNNNLSYFLNMVASVLQCCTIINIYFMNKMVFLMFFWLKIG